MSFNYSNFLKSPPKNIWKRIGVHRRCGVVIPLFSIYSGESTHIGEIPDLKLIVDWCVKAGMSIIQFLPLNEVSYDFSPYNCISTFALEPMYLRLSELKGVDPAGCRDQINKLKSKYKPGNKRVNYDIKKDKLNLLWKLFLDYPVNDNSFYSFIENNKYWIKDYAVYKILKEENKYISWENWKPAFSSHSRLTIRLVEKKFPERIKFYYWLQWQLYEQLKQVKKYANLHNVLIMGDLPFLVSRDSVDVWSHQKYFKLNKSAGAPPDMYFAFGQKWGMPPYDWKEIEKDKYTFPGERLRYSENFYNMYRIDHFVGLFRIWTFDHSENDHHGGFDPPKKSQWEAHGKKIINAMLAYSEMLPCAEDLGTVPACSYKTLKEYKLPGTDFQRFNKNKKFGFVSPDKYRKNSTAVISTHDSSFFPVWWDFEAGTIDENLFKYLCREHGIKGKFYKEVKKKLFNPRLSTHGKLHWKTSINNVAALTKILGLKLSDAEEFIELYLESNNEKSKFSKSIFGRGKITAKSSPRLQKLCLKKTALSASVFSIQLLHEYLYLDEHMFRKMNRRSYRINKPGISDEKNWSVRIPLSLEKLIYSKQGEKIIEELKEINRSCGRI